MGEEKYSTEQKRKQHVQELKEKALKLVDDPDCFYMDGSLSLEAQEKFLERLLLMEEAEEQPLYDQLGKSGIRMLSPETLDDVQLHEKLWEVINAMARLGHYLSSTDHLSDRELYELLWKDVLRQPTSIVSDPSTISCHIDILGGCSAEDMKIRMKYYADDEERDWWESDFPDDELPPKEPLPFNRDSRLPVPAALNEF